MEFNFSFKTGKKPPAESVKESAVSMLPLYEKLPLDFITNYLNTSQEGKHYNSAALQWMYDNIGEISLIIRYIAEKLAELPRKHVRITPDGEEIDLGYTDVMRLLDKPNQYDSDQIFIQNLTIAYLIHGNVPVNVVTATGFRTPTSLYVLPPTDVYAIPQFSDGVYGLPTPTVDFRFNPVTHYNYMIDGVPKRIEKEAMIYIKGANVNYKSGGWMYGQSKIYAASRSVDTLSLIYDVLNAVLSSPLGFVKRNAKAGGSIDPYAGFGDTDKKQAEKRLNPTKANVNTYGTRSGKYGRFVTRADLGYTSMVEPLSKFMPVELKDAEFETLCNIFYAIPTELFNSKKASTYNNMTQADKVFYTKCLMPLSASLYNPLSDGLGLSKRNEYIKADFSGVDALQADKKLQAEVESIQTATALNLFQNGYEQAGQQIMTDCGLPFEKVTNEKETP